MSAIKSMCAWAICIRDAFDRARTTQEQNEAQGTVGPREIDPQRTPKALAIQEALSLRLGDEAIRAVNALDEAVSRFVSAAMNQDPGNVYRLDEAWALNKAADHLLAFAPSAGKGGAQGVPTVEPLPTRSKLEQRGVMSTSENVLREIADWAPLLSRNYPRLAAEYQCARDHLARVYELWMQTVDADPRNVASRNADGVDVATLGDPDLRKEVEVARRALADYDHIQQEQKLSHAKYSHLRDDIPDGACVKARVDLGKLAELVATHLPEVFEKLRLVTRLPDAWYLDANFDWKPVITELKVIETAAIQRIVAGARVAEAGPLMEGQRQQKATDSVQQSEKPTATRVSVEQALHQAEAYVSHHGFPGLNVLAKYCGCHHSTLRKAVTKSEKLQRAQAAHELQAAKPRPKSKAADDPSRLMIAEEALRQLIEYAPESRRAELNTSGMRDHLAGMEPDALARLLDDEKKQAETRARAQARAVRE